MKRIEHTILKRQIPDVHLHSVSGTFWFGTEINDWKSWYSGLTPISGMVPSSNDTGSLHLVRDIKWYPDITYTGSVVLFYSGKTYQSLIDSNLNNIPSGSVHWKEVEQVAINNTKGKYYKWDGDNWNLYTGFTGYEYVVPVFLESTVDELGVMVSFDGGVEQIEQLCNFTYTQTGSVVTVYNSVNPDKLRKIVGQEYTIHWGDLSNTTSNLIVSSSVVGQGLPSSSFTYPTVTGSTTGSYTLTLSLDSPWTKEKISKNIFISTGSILSQSEILGTFTGMTIPAYTNLTGQTQDYLYNVDNSGYIATPTKPLRFMGIGKSRINELKQYGTSSIPGMTTGKTADNIVWSGYTIDGLYYQDFPDDYTMITGSVPNHRYGPTSGYTYEISGNTYNTVPYLTTSGNTTEFVTEFVINNMLTRNEHFLGFIDDPTIYSDIFVERGRQGVMENNLRLGEIDNMSELDVYGNGYFNVKKQ
jgi:predicted aconitase with swiveling domain